MSWTYDDVHGGWTESRAAGSIGACTLVMDVGAHCTVSSCNVRDFLPIACKCNNLYCRDHISPDLHLCAAIHEYDPSQSSGLAKLRRCDFEGCNKSSLFAFTAEPERETCEKCRKAFCVEYVNGPYVHPFRF